MAGVDGVSCGRPWRVLSCSCCGAPLAHGRGVGDREEVLVGDEVRFFSEAVAEERVRLARAFPGVSGPALGQAAVALAFLRWLEERERRGLVRPARSGLI